MDLPINYDKASAATRKLVREEYVRLQNGFCYHCGATLKEKAPIRIMKKSVDRRRFPPNFFKWPVHLHHSHDTGMTIGAVHCYCNAVLWQYHNE